MNKNQQKNRMGAVIILLAAACLNGYAQQDSTKVASNSKMVCLWYIIRILIM